MNSAQFKFYKELNDFLPSSGYESIMIYSFNGNPSVKDAIEAQGIPHVETGLIMINGNVSGFSDHLKNNDSVEVYPFEGDHNEQTGQRFIADIHLGKLSRFLRFCGFDTCPVQDDNSGSIPDISLSEKRIVLTRDRNLLKNKKILSGYWLRSEFPGEQLKEVFKRYNLADKIMLFSRCMLCNAQLSQVSKEDVYGRLLPKTLEFFNEYKMCPQCRRIYWKGSHYDRMVSSIEILF